MAPGGLRSQLEHFRAFPLDAKQNKVSAMNKITIPVLVLGGDIYPALGGDYPANMGLSSTQALSSNVTGMIVPLSGHWIPEEQPKFVIEQLAMFLTSKFIHRLGLIASVILYLHDTRIHYFGLGRLGKDVTRVGN